MRKLLVAAVMLLSLVALNLPATAADPCGRDNQVSCIEQGLQELNDCCNTFGCNSNWSVSYCDGKFNDTYKGCMVLKGCANPPPPQM